MNATFLAYGQTLQVDPGVVIFDGPIDNPSLQITAWRRNQAVEAGVQVSGTVRNADGAAGLAAAGAGGRAPVVAGARPRAERRDAGRPGHAAGGGRRAALAAATRCRSTGASRASSAWTRSRCAARGELAGNVVAVGKRLSDRVYVSYEQGIGAVASNLIKLDYALGRRWTLRAETGTSSGGGLFYRYSWD